MRSAALAVVVAVFVTASGADAQELGELGKPRQDKGWRYEIDPYAWIPLGISGDATVRNREIPVDASLGDMMKDFDLGAMARFEAWNGRFGVIADGTFLKASQSGNLPGPLGASFDWTSRLLAGDLLLGARPIVASLGGERVLSVEIDAGGRFAWLDSDATIAGESVSSSSSFGKFVIGARVPLRLNRRWGLGVRGTLSAPDVGWSSFGWAEFNPTKGIGLMAAYRVEHIELSSGSVALSATTHGPYVGLGFRFGSGPIY